MKSHFLKLLILISLASCDPTDPIVAVDYKIKTLTVLFNADTAFYKFVYNASTGNLDTVFKNYSLMHYLIILVVM